MISQEWKLLYENPLRTSKDAEGFRMEGEGRMSFPAGRMVLESGNERDGEQANFVLWLPDDFPPDITVKWDFRPLREPGLAIIFFAAKGVGGCDLFHSSLAKRTGKYEQYHHGDIDAFHLSYYRRRWPEERQFHTCNLRKSYGFHMAAQGADPLPAVADCTVSYRMLLIKRGSCIQFSINELPVLTWEDDGEAFGPLLGAGKIGFRQMSPFIAEYANLKIYGLAAG
ncbi:hypothetical protein FHS15_000364 [Paenibacillus castaneae]|uniref:DUF1961 family protein n=1 Tax=Paenibacillus castaneae TaxID=474957 RepID=UPI000C9C03CB|nr:DUF1961 family protein [Paenibacillus castaneae]NIK75266.1 hypothetical protein [Paenibacillus castaneae]